MLVEQSVTLIDIQPSTPTINAQLVLRFVDVIWSLGQTVNDCFWWLWTINPQLSNCYVANCSVEHFVTIIAIHPSRPTIDDDLVLRIVDAFWSLYWTANDCFWWLWTMKPNCLAVAVKNTLWNFCYSTGHTPMPTRRVVDQIIS